ncbi:Proteasome subunit beta type-6 [Vitis vinifera]|uniref:Proteasome subunit beta type-6 n=1 Tax=Vitis vinifera TaxID=29760 RepID=A0A438DG68_VITVI|nr:Proteasome subunit beta type-6 [Vitis vinifera]
MLVDNNKNVHAADSQILSDYVRYYLHQHTHNVSCSIQLGQPATVKVAANLVRLISYNNKNMLQTGLIVGGWTSMREVNIWSASWRDNFGAAFAIGGVFSSYDKNYPYDDSALITYYFENCSFWLVVDGDYLFLL